MDSTDRSCILAAIFFGGLAIFGAYMNFWSNRWSTNPADWKRLETTVLSTNISCPPRESCVNHVYLADLDDPVTCLDRIPACHALYHRLQQGERVSVLYRCDLVSALFGDGCYLAAMKTSEGDALLSLQQNAVFWRKGQFYVIAEMLLMASIALGSLVYLGYKHSHHKASFP